MNILAFILISVLLPILALSCVAYFVISIIKQRGYQRDIKNSIVLVELKTRRTHYYIFLGIVVAIVGYAFYQLIDTSSYDFVAFMDKFGLDKWSIYVAISSVILCLLVFICLLIVIISCKAALVDHGVYTGLTYFKWDKVHDYIVDMQKYEVVLTGHKAKFFTLLGTSTPLKVPKEDMQKLIFIISKNKKKL